LYDFRPFDPIIDLHFSAYWPPQRYLKSYACGPKEEQKISNPASTTVCPWWMPQPVVEA